MQKKGKQRIAVKQATHLKNFEKGNYLYMKAYADVFTSKLIKKEKLKYQLSAISILQTPPPIKWRKRVNKKGSLYLNVFCSK